MLTLSVCIPCIEPHLPFLGRCVESISNQIYRPHEVIVSLSNITSDKSQNLSFIKDTVERLIGRYRNKLDIIVIYTTERRYAGENRNIAIEHATGDIVSMIDCDDCMYSNRLYILMKIFTYYPKAIGILHYFNENKNINDEEPIWNFDENDIQKYQYTPKLHYGHPSFRRIIFQEFKYSNMRRGQDFAFIESILPKYIDNLYIYKQKLSCYHSNDSTFYNEAIRAMSGLSI